MTDRRKFRPVLDGLEGRLALSGMVAGLNQGGNYQDQSGDQTSVDTPGTGLNQGGNHQEQSGDQTSPDTPGTGRERGGEAPGRAEGVELGASHRPSHVNITHSHSPKASGGHHVPVSHHAPVRHR